MQQEYDAFTQGVSLGGLRTRYDIKVLLCYVLSGLDRPISKSGLNAALQITELANFFEVNAALGEITENGLAKCEKRDDDEYYSLLPKGRDAARHLETDIPHRVRDMALKAAMEVAAKERKRCGVEAITEKRDDGYYAVLTIKDGDCLMLKTSLYCSDSLQADVVCRTFLDEPEKLYSAVIDSITH